MNWPFPRHPWPQSKHFRHWTFDQDWNRPFYTRKTNTRRSRTATPRPTPSPPTTMAAETPPPFQSSPSSPLSPSFRTQLLQLYTLTRVFWGVFPCLFLEKIGRKLKRLRSQRETDPPTVAEDFDSFVTVIPLHFGGIDGLTLSSGV